MRLIPSAGYIYLASPYTHPDPFVRELRYLWTMRELTAMLKEGLAVYSPIVHCHELAKIADLPTDAAFWRRYDFIMLAGAEVFGVLMLPGWEQSVGLADEQKEAKRCNLQTLFIEPKAFP